MAEPTQNDCADFIATLAEFFVCHASGPGERAYSVGEIGVMIREWANALRTAEWNGSYLTPGSAKLSEEKANV